jgi:hypothetical protein
MVSDHESGGSRLAATNGAVVHAQQHLPGQRWAERAVRSNRILLFLAGLTLGLSTLAGLLMHVIDREAFPTVGTGVWWAVVTFCTVGYGDVIPESALARTVAGVVMVFAITFIAIFTALVTSTLVSGQERRRDEARSVAEHTLHETLARIEHRLDALERRLT